MNRTNLLIVAFYLSKFDKIAITNLGYNGFRDAFRRIGEKLGYSPNTVKNRRDDFDPLFPHRAGWYQVELSSKSLNIVDKFDHLSEEGLRAIVLDILNQKMDNELNTTLENVNEERKYAAIGLTGKKAEAYFIEWFSENYPNSVLIDTRDLGCGYDFAVKDSEKVFEVKGVSGSEGGIRFTDKEWSVANAKESDYVLVIVSNCFSDAPNLDIHTNPSEYLEPVKQISTVIAVNWNVSPKQLKQQLQ
jgi:hypothetical protein